jgi:ribonuclease BN (tRNA processing enzyme)
VASLFECFYPGLADRRAFDIVYGELKRGEQVPWQGLLISAYEVEHPSGLPSLAISVEDKARRFSFSGDSGWCEGLFEAGRNADLYLIECTTFATRTGVHLDYLTLASNFDKIGAAKYLLTHMSEEMLGSTAKIDSAKCILATDGLSVEV